MCGFIWTFSQGKAGKSAYVTIKYDTVASIPFYFASKRSQVVFDDDCRSIKMWDLRRTHCTKKSGLVPKYSFDYAGTSIRTHGWSNQ